MNMKTGAIWPYLLLTFGCLQSLATVTFAFVPSSTFFSALPLPLPLHETQGRAPFALLSACQNDVEVAADENERDERKHFLEASASVSTMSSRRKVIKQAFSFTGSSTLATILSCKINAPCAAAALPTPDISVYEVITDTSTSEKDVLPSIKSVNLSAFDRILSLQQKKINHNNGGVVWLGEHHNSQKDHKLQTQIIQSIYNQQVEVESSTRSAKSKDVHVAHNMSIGLEQVQLQFQPFLDDYIAGSITEEQMLNGVQWSTRWQWEYYDNYRPVFQLARKLSIPLIALNVNSEDLAIIEESGIQGLDKSQLRRYITADLKGFGTFITPSSYKAYSAYVIEPSYSMHRQMGVLKRSVTGRILDNEMSFANFFSGRIMWDESMASHAYQWTKSHPGGIMVGLIGADHVKFEMGVVGRYKRLIERDIQIDQIYQEKLLAEERERQREKELFIDQIVYQEEEERQREKELFIDPIYQEKLSTEERQREKELVAATSNVISVSVANAATSTTISPTAPAANRTSSSNFRRECISVLLNPTLIDSRPSGSVNAYADASALSSSYPDKITLQLPYRMDGTTPGVGYPEERESPSTI
eukprot:CAMPEP_0194108776 /NCGR_PEP_ID=MMETSP0150-20130528/8417_1 /TAXON_ID=122233 /ORGANISM="Chaetoceros debilis, Strain MM31A-1" /LENGTH=588 /DNA_ID=CAMNT_0038797565 /DNA_START=277 /DNA_END=2040 /DNA_ORIENTATION=+